MKRRADGAKRDSGEEKERIHKGRDEHGRHECRGGQEQEERGTTFFIHPHARGCYNASTRVYKKGRSCLAALVQSAGALATQYSTPLQAGYNLLAIACVNNGHSLLAWCPGHLAFPAVELAPPL